MCFPRYRNFRYEVPSCQTCTMQNRKLEYEQQRLEKEVADMQEAFDSALALLSREKLSLEADVKAAHIKRLTYQQEMQLLKVDLYTVNSAPLLTTFCPFLELQTGLAAA